MAFKQKGFSSALKIKQNPELQNRFFIVLVPLILLRYSKGAVHGTGRIDHGCKMEFISIFWVKNVVIKHRYCHLIQGQRLFWGVLLGLFHISQLLGITVTKLEGNCAGNLRRTWIYKDFFYRNRVYGNGKKVTL